MLLIADAGQEISLFTYNLELCSAGKASILSISTYFLLDFISFSFSGSLWEEGII